MHIGTKKHVMVINFPEKIWAPLLTPDFQSSSRAMYCLPCPYCYYLKKKVSGLKINLTAEFEKKNNITTFDKKKSLSLFFFLNYCIIMCNNFKTLTYSITAIGNWNCNTNDQNRWCELYCKIFQSRIMFISEAETK